MKQEKKNAVQKFKKAETHKFFLSGITRAAKRTEKGKGVVGREKGKWRKEREREIKNCTIGNQTTAFPLERKERNLKK